MTTAEASITEAQWMAASAKAKSLSGQDRAPRPATRARILTACRRLFNERGPVAVTTAEIAADVHINEGNLYYHYQRKEQILEALFGAFEQQLLAVATSHAPGDDENHADSAGQRYRDYLDRWFALMWEWRFIYRDGAAIFRIAPALRERVAAATGRGQGHIRDALSGMRALGLLQASAVEIESLMVNAWIVSTYWIDYLRTSRGIDELRREHLAWGASQVASLFRPFLTTKGLALVEPRSQ